MSSSGSLGAYLEAEVISFPPEIENPTLIAKSRLVANSKYTVGSDSAKDTFLMLGISAYKQKCTSGQRLGVMHVHDLNWAPVQASSCDDFL